MTNGNSGNKLLWTLQSRKFWTAVVGLISILVYAWQSGEAVDPEVIVTAIMAIVGAYIGSVAYEDGQRAKAEATVSAASISANFPTPPSYPAEESRYVEPTLKRYP